MTVQNNNSKMSACPELAIYLLQIPIPIIFYSLFDQNEQFILALEDGLFGKY